KAFRVFNSRTRKIEENMHVNFLENKPNVAGSGSEWLFNIDSLTKSMNYEPVSAGNQSNGDAGDVNAGDIQGDVDEISRNDDVYMPTLEATGIFDGAFNDRDLGAEADTNNLDSSTVVSPIPTTKVHKDYPKEQIIGDPNLNTQTRRMINFFEETAMVSFINMQRRTNHKDF
nr:ribonuclease H-like domain-containing protein [Tanacetum cinerariifolium]